ncbi:MAG: methionine gamma-lyase family protein [Christensenellaceae bacterium]|jgi:cystathionine beta-lyase family protein involved in aluminum resistance|nr:methionine gamma-lyase family protein [Christensenellaceae bacterium]
MKEIPCNIIKNAENEAKEMFSKFEEISMFNQRKVMNSFRENKVSARHFNHTTGYGYDDVGRETLCRIFAESFGSEKAIVSPLIASGTHALTIALFGLLRPGNRILSITGDPYDTLHRVITGEDIGSLKDFGINYDSIPMLNDKIDYQAVTTYLSTNSTDLIFITRSKGYTFRDALSVDEIKVATEFIKSISPNSIVFVDNCYGEFVEMSEPCAVGADIMVGSLIKNPGGGLAPTGGYIAGKEKLIDNVCNRVTAPSIGLEIGSYNTSYLPFFQGFFMAPAIVENALKTGVVAAYAYTSLGFAVSPLPNVMPHDLIRAIKFDSDKELIEFIRAIQYSSVVDSFVTPFPWAMPGYVDNVIMAGGSFIQGGSLELSADAPIRRPYTAYLQGALTYQHGKIAIEETLGRIFAYREKKEAEELARKESGYDPSGKIDIEALINEAKKKYNKK